MWFRLFIIVESRETRRPFLGGVTGGNLFLAELETLSELADMLRRKLSWKVEACGLCCLSSFEDCFKEPCNLRCTKKHLIASRSGFATNFLGAGGVIRVR